MKTYARREAVGSQWAQVTVWTGTQWQVIGQTTNGLYAPQLVVFDDGNGPGLIAAGDFTIINGVAATGFAMWRNGAWTALGSEYYAYRAKALRVFDDGSGPAVYAIFQPQSTPGLASESIARWNGQAWSSVGGGLGSPGAFIGINSIGVFDDGFGPALFVGGGFSVAGGVPVSNIARWNGAVWSSPGTETGGYVETMAALDDGNTRALFIGGDFIRVGGGLSPNLARWVGCPNCYANCDGSTGSPRLTANDFMCFINRYVVRDPYANCTVDAEINAADFMCFMNKFAAGCP